MQPARLQLRPQLLPLVLCLVHFLCKFDWRRTCVGQARPGIVLVDTRFLIAFSSQCIKTHTHTHTRLKSLSNLFRLLIYAPLLLLVLLVVFLLLHRQLSLLFKSFCCAAKVRFAVRIRRVCFGCATLRILVNRLKCLQEGLSHPLNPHTHTRAHTRAHTHAHTLSRTHTLSRILTINDRTKFETFSTASYIIAHWPRPSAPPLIYRPSPRCPAIFASPSRGDCCEIHAELHQNSN